MGATPQARLAVETALYEANKSVWLHEHRNEFVVVKDEEVLGFFSEFHEAYQRGVEKYGIDSDFLVKRVVPQEPVFVVF